jgi:heterodisulfide reductase subunit D
LKTPHIALLCLDVLDLLGVDYEVMGGPGQCCGVYQFREGDFENTARISYATIDGLASAGTSTVLSWCPSCQVQIGEVTLPSYEARFGARPFDLNPFLVFLADHADTLAPMMRHRVEKRVALHERPVLPSVQAAVRKLLAIIPGVELIEIDVQRVGTQANSLAVLPAFKRELVARELAAVAMPALPRSRRSTMPATASFAMSATGAASRSSISWSSSAKGSVSMPRISTSASR